VLDYQGKHEESEELHRRTSSKMEKVFGSRDEKAQASIKALTANFHEAK